MPVLVRPTGADAWDHQPVPSDGPAKGSLMRVTMLLADAAQEVNGKLYVLGGGWSVTGPDVPPMSLAIKLDVPWSAANQAHRFEIVLVDTDGHPVRGAEGGVEVRVDGQFEVGRPAGLPAGSDIDVAFAVNVPPFPLAPGRYAWQLSIDGDTREDWLRPFQVRARG
jgi:hypothetical protein